VQHLAEDIGSRPTGSPAEQQAADWLQAQLRASGFEASLQSFPVRRFEDRGATLEILAPESRSIATTNLQYGGSGDVTADVVAAGLGHPDDFPAETPGRIALIDRGEITFQAKVDAATAAGAVGVIVVNNEPGDLNGTLVSPATIPVVAVSQGDGEAIKTLLQPGPARVHLTSSTSITESMSQNVVAVKRRADAPVIVVGGHYDSVAAGPGANDNASGTAVALEIVRALADETRAEVRFVAFGAEEIGLVGSRAYVDGLSAAERARVKLVVNLDMVGVGEQLLIGGSDEPARAAADLARQRGIANVIRSDADLGRSDQASFLSAGIPAVFLHWESDPNYHTAGDRASEVRPELLERAGLVALDLIRVTLDAGS
jgi:aminopeptidase YwaD